MIALLLAFAAHAASLDEARARYRDEFLDPLAHVELADALYREGRPVDGYYVLAEARRWFPPAEFAAARARVIGAGPGEPDARARQYLRDKRWVEAAYWLEASLKDDPESAYALSMLSSLHRKELKDPEGALKWDLLLSRLPLGILEDAAVEDRVRHALNRRRDAAVHAAKDVGDLRAMFGSADGDLRAEAALQAGKRKERALIPELIARLDDDVGVVTQNADYALFQIAKAVPGALEPHQAGLLGADSPFVRGKVFNLYGDLDPARARPWVLEGLSSPDEYVRLRAHMAARHYYAADKGVQAAAAKALRGASGGLLAALERLKKRR